MNIAAIEHKFNSEFCYALDDNGLMIILRTGNCLLQKGILIYEECYK